MSRSAWVRIVITAAALALILRKVDAGETMRALGRLRAGPVLIVLGLLALDRAVMVWRWVILLRATRQSITPGAAVRIHLVSSFIGNFLPAGVGADVARVYSVRQQTASGSGAAASVAVDRLFGLLSIGFVGLLGSPRRRTDGIAAGARAHRRRSGRGRHRHGRPAVDRPMDAGRAAGALACHGRGIAHPARR